MQVLARAHAVWCSSPLLSCSVPERENSPQGPVESHPHLGVKIDLLFHLSARKLPSLAVMNPPSDITSEINCLRPEGTAMTI